jgi:hypothetical protein
MYTIEEGVYKDPDYSGFKKISHLSNSEFNVGIFLNPYYFSEEDLICLRNFQALKSKTTPIQSSQQKVIEMEDSQMTDMKQIFQNQLLSDYVRLMMINMKQLEFKRNQEIVFLNKGDEALIKYKKKVNSQGTEIFDDYSISRRIIRWHGESKGHYFSGSVFEENRNGNGYYKWPCGDDYLGYWLQNKMNGIGLYTDLKGTKSVGFFKKDKKVGIWIEISNDEIYIKNYTSSDNNEFYRLWLNDEGVVEECSDDKIDDYENETLRVQFPLNQSELIKKREQLYKLYKNFLDKFENYKNVYQLITIGHIEENKNWICEVENERWREEIDGRPTGTYILTKDPEEKFYVGEITHCNDRVGFGYLRIDDTDFMGNWVGDELFGYALVTYENGDRYYGQINDFEKKDIGLYEYLNGDILITNYVKDSREGNGLLFSNGIEYDVTFEDDDLVSIEIRVEISIEFAEQVEE